MGATYILIAAITIIASVFILFIYSYFFSGHVLKILQKISQELHDRFYHLLRTLKQGVRKISTNQLEFFKVILLSVPIWIIEATMMYFLILGLGYEVPYSVCILAAIFGFLSEAIPLLPAGWGYYEAVIASMLIFLGGLPGGVGLTIAIIDHIIRMVYTALMGAPSLSLSNISIGSLLETAKNFRKREILE